MKIRKKEIMEVIDSNGELIGNNNIPTTGSDLESQANNTTDYNQKIGTQPYRYDMLGRFGFSLLPFMEGKEDQSQQDLLYELSDLMHEKFAEVQEYYYRHPNKLKSDFRKSKDDDYKHDEECEKNDIYWAKKAIKIFEKYFEKSMKNQEKIDESKVVEDKMVDKKSEDEISKKTEDNTIKDKKITQIAGLINKLDQKDVDKLKNLLERK